MLLHMHNGCHDVALSSRENLMFAKMHKYYCLFTRGNILLRTVVCHDTDFHSAYSYILLVFGFHLRFHNLKRFRPTHFRYAVKLWFHFFMQLQASLVEKKTSPLVLCTSQQLFEWCMQTIWQWIISQ